MNDRNTIMHDTESQADMEMQHLEQDIQEIQVKHKRKQIERTDREAGIKHFFIDAVVLLVILILWKNYLNATDGMSSAFSYETEAEVTDILACEFTGTAEQAKGNGMMTDAKYAAVLEYYAGSQKVQKYLYYRKKPVYTAGEIVKIRVSFFNKDDILILK